MLPLIQNVFDLIGLSIGSLVFFAIADSEMRAHVISTIAQVDFESFVSENLFLVSENRVGEGWLEGSEGLQTRLGRLDQTNVEDIVGLLQPCKSF